MSERTMEELTAELRKIMQEHTREVYLKRLKRCGVIMRDKDGRQLN